MVEKEQIFWHVDLAELSECLVTREVRLFVFVQGSHGVVVI